MSNILKFTVKKNEEKIIPIILINEEKELTLDVRMLGEDSSLKIIAIFYGENDSFVKFNTNVIHEAPRTKSLTTIRGVFKNNSSFTNDGLISIRNKASGSDGYFSSKILLFDDARGRSVPSLEIDENDLKAGHASTIGRPDPLELFYLQSRGLSEKDAEDLIVSGFFKPLIDILPSNDKLYANKMLDEYIHPIDL